MKVTFGEIGFPLYCDAGPNQGDMRVDLSLSLYLTADEYARYDCPETLRIGLAGTAPDSTASLLLCDGCFEAATSLVAECQDGCRHRDLDHSGQCLSDSPDECQWCGTEGRLREVPRAGVINHLPTVGEEDDGLWWRHFNDGAQCPFPTAQAAWDHWHSSGHRVSPPSPGAPTGTGGAAS